MPKIKLDLNNLTLETYEKWLAQYNYEPYVYDEFLQKIDWVNRLTKAIKEVEKVLGEEHELQYRFWKKLSAWEFILNSISIARNFGFSFKPDISWGNLIAIFRFWVDNIINTPGIKDLYFKGASFIPDMVNFFANNRTLINPITLANEVLNWIEKNKKEGGGNMVEEIIFKNEKETEEEIKKNESLDEELSRLKEIENLEEEEFDELEEDEENEFEEDEEDEEFEEEDDDDNDDNDDDDDDEEELEELIKLEELTEEDMEKQVEKFISELENRYLEERTSILPVLFKVVKRKYDAEFGLREKPLTPKGTLSIKLDLHF